MNYEKTSVSATIEIPSDHAKDGLYVVCVAFRLRENAEAATRILKRNGIETSICEIPAQKGETDG